MNLTEARLIEQGWAALVERLGLAEATRFIMLLDRRTGGALQHLDYMRPGTHYKANRTYETYTNDGHFFSHTDEAGNSTGQYS